MSQPQTQTSQTPKIEQILRKRVVEPRIIEVTRKTYRILRSFVESSSKNKYIWNLGRKVAENKVVFEKEGKWILEVLIDEAGNPVVELSDYKKTVLTFREGKIVIEDYVFDIWSLYDDEMQLSTAFLPVSKRPYDVPIYLYDIVKKLREYVTI